MSIIEKHRREWINLAGEDLLRQSDELELRFAASSKNDPALRDTLNADLDDLNSFASLIIEVLDYLQSLEKAQEEKIARVRRELELGVAQ